jgi:hypothetical protein
MYHVRTSRNRTQIGDRGTMAAYSGIERACLFGCFNVRQHSSGCKDIGYQRTLAQGVNVANDVQCALTSYIDTRRGYKYNTRLVESICQSK